MRDFWKNTQAFAEKDYIVFEQDRYTYAQTNVKVLELANLLLSYGVTKGDRVAIVMR